MRKNSDNSKKRKGKTFTVTRNFNGTLDAEEFIAKLVKEYINKENQKP